LVINGLGKDKATDKKVFEAFGVVNEDRDGKFQLNTYTLEGRHTLASIEPTEVGYDWWFDIPNRGTIKYKIKLTESTWIEDGSFSSDGNNWYPFFHMQLTKIK